MSWKHWKSATAEMCRVLLWYPCYTVIIVLHINLVVWSIVCLQEKVMNRIKLKRISGIFTAASVLLITIFTSQMANAAHYVQSGMACMPANLSQALSGPLGWDHMRVRNNSAQQLWVVCSVPNTLEDVNGSQYDINGGNIAVEAWFGSSASGSAQVYCILREVLGAGTGTTGDTDTMTITANGSLPDVNANSITANGYAAGTSAITATCRMDPGTGIQAIRVTLV